MVTNMTLYCQCVKCFGSEPEYLCENDVFNAFVLANKPLINKHNIKKNIKNILSVDNIVYVSMALTIIFVILDSIMNTKP